MVSLDEFAALATALEGVLEADLGGRRHWTLDGRTVARELDVDSVVIHTDFPEREALLRAHPETFCLPPRFAAHMLVVAELKFASPEALERALRAAWDRQPL